MSTLTVRLTASEIQGILDALPRCLECPRRGELLVDRRLLCCACAAKRRHGRTETPGWTNGAVTLSEALLTP